MKEGRVKMEQSQKESSVQLHLTLVISSSAIYHVELSFCAFEMCAYRLSQSGEMCFENDELIK